MPIRVAALYRFASFPDPAALKPGLLATCLEQGVNGTLLLAGEGINGTIAGSDDGIAAVIDHIRTFPGCAGLEVRESRAATPPFHRMKVRVKREIVTMGVASVDPVAGAGAYVLPADWNALIADPDTIVIDTRNDYEVGIGTFEGAVDPATASFREFPDWVRANRDRLEGKRIAMFCTGGIRCEKATALVSAEGFDDVHHLKGGILNYLETVPESESLWRGECFVFDERVAVTHGLAGGTHALCRACRMPVSAADRASPLYREGIACPACHDRRDDAQRAGYAERARQAALAEVRGERHVGASYPLRGDDLP
ncbi:oxygen-dependent tRNA uridine(34) hydroxylase TrhO [Sphingomonas sp.]|uniref:oxygen-dependent tRNA uridine(34) hydroxylase TrhO n=1 Tax=Sphingomonas sp. TaxID=28214 RepID=UPI002DD6687C|nr:rhodanese-related sulfurtransferase [Sphingomonas sp.]